jgi:type VI secretion system protein ImpM
MERYGYFGKIPSAKDFIFQGLPMRTTERWAGHMAEWLARGNRVHKDAWRRHVLTSPVWRFALGKGIVGPESWIGLFASSIDGAGRLFPFTAMLEIEIDPSRQQPFDAIDQVLDRFEPFFLDFMESGAEKQGLLKALEEVLSGLRALPTETPKDELLLPDVQDQAVGVLEGPSETDSRSVIVHPGRASTKEGSPAYSAWWQGGTSTAAAAKCICRGMPEAPIALAFFDADWDRHGWVRR